MMSPAQARVYGFIAQYIDDHKYPPTVREIQLGLGYGSPSTVQVHMEILRDKGFLAGAGRTLRLGWRDAP
jgi:repressor LexA